MNKVEENILSKEKIETIMIQQGRKVLVTINTPGWEIIENCLKICKQKAESQRRKENRIQSTREKMLYWNGVVDGVQDALDEIYNIVSNARNIEAGKAQMAKMEGL